MIRGIAIGGVVGCLLAVFFTDLDHQARATYAVAIAVFLLVHATLSASSGTRPHA